MRSTVSEIPSDLFYTEEHEWVQRTGDDTVRVGITDYAQSALGDVVFVAAARRRHGGGRGGVVRRGGIDEVRLRSVRPGHRESRCRQR